MWPPAEPGHLLVNHRPIRDEYSTLCGLQVVAVYANRASQTRAYSVVDYLAEDNRLVYTLAELMHSQRPTCPQCATVRAMFPSDDDIW